MLTEIEVKVSESPVFMVTEEFSAMENSNVPLVLADQNEMSVSTSPLVPAQFVHAGSVPLAAIDPADADAHVTAGRVVTLDTFAVPFAPGAPVCNCTLAALPVQVPSAEFAFAAVTPSATQDHLFRAGHDPLARLAARAAGERPRPGAGVELGGAAGGRRAAHLGGHPELRLDDEVVSHADLQGGGYSGLACCTAAMPSIWHRRNVSVRPKARCSGNPEAWRPM